MHGSSGIPYPRLESQVVPGDAAYKAAGGPLVRFIAGAALNIGDVVYISAADTVNKSVTAANYQTFAGVVVGGKATDFGVGNFSTDVGLAAAASGEEVLVQIAGRAWVVADAAVAANAKLAAGATTAGRVDDSASATAGQVIGVSLQAAASAGDKIQMLVFHM